MARTTVWVSSDFALQGAELVSGESRSFLSVKKGVEMLLLNNTHNTHNTHNNSNNSIQEQHSEAVHSPPDGQSDVSILLSQGLDYLSRSPHETLGVTNAIILCHMPYLSYCLLILFSSCITVFIRCD
jgi:hypothetical protein